MINENKSRMVDLKQGESFNGSRRVANNLGDLSDIQAAQQHPQLMPSALIDKTDAANITRGLLDRAGSVR
jgi:hypothetical protein